MDIRWAPGFSLSQAMDMLEGDEEMQEHVDKIFITPPEINVDSDEDSADDDDGGMVYTLTGRQLRAAAEVQLTNNDKMDHFVVSCQRRRCAWQGCKSFGRTMCQKGNVGLCVNCFPYYHTK